MRVRMSRIDLQRLCEHPHSLFIVACRHAYRSQQHLCPDIVRILLSELGQLYGSEIPAAALRQRQRLIVSGDSLGISVQLLLTRSYILQIKGCAVCLGIEYIGADDPLHQRVRDLPALIIYKPQQISRIYIALVELERSFQTRGSAAEISLGGQLQTSVIEAV